MVTAYQELGSTMENSVKIFGTIQNAAKDSGIGFEKTKKHIIEGAQAMKMWGGTVESVTPVFNAFAKSLGEGRKGLAPELFRGMIDGIKIMGFETRALLGLQAGGGQRGALQAGFEMEAALEEGPQGMQKVMGSVMDTLKQFGGGRITTLKEAAKDPDAARNFAMQRGLMEKLLGITGANANRTLEMLSGIQDGGMQLSENMSKDLHAMVSGGREIGAQTATDMEKAAAEQSAAFDKGSEAIIGELKTLLTGSDFNKIMSGISKSLSDSIKTGKVDITAIIRGLKDAGMMGDQKTQRAAVRAERSGRAAVRRLESRQQPTTAEAAEQVSRGRPPKIPPRADMVSGATPVVQTGTTPSQTPITPGAPTAITPAAPATIIPAAEPLTAIPELPPIPPAQPIKSVVPASITTTPAPLPPAPPEPPPLLPGGPGSQIDMPEPPPEGDRYGFSINRAMEQYRKMRATDKRATPVTQGEMAEEAINQAQAVVPTTAKLARQNINTTTDAREQQMSATPAPQAQAAPGDRQTPGTRVKPKEIEVKIKVTMEGGNINLTPLMEEKVKRIITSQN
jgi:hypothetical protein